MSGNRSNNRRKRNQRAAQSVAVLRRARLVAALFPDGSAVWIPRRSRAQAVWQARRTTFIAEHSRLVGARLRAEQNGEVETAAEGLGLLIDLMREIDRCERDVVFFADEAGSWQVGVHWDRVLPVWFRSLSTTMGVYEWAETVVCALNDFASQQRDEILAVAREAGTVEQRVALAEYEGDLRSQRR